MNMIQGIPEIPYSTATAPTIAAAFNMTSTLYATACIFPVRKLGTLTKIHFRFVASNIGNDYLIQVETVDPATGDPSGTLWGANTSHQTGTGIAAGEYVATLTAGATFNTINEPFAITWRPTTYVGSSTIGQYNDGSAGDLMPFLASTTNYTLGVWAARSGAPMIGLEYSDGTFVMYPGNFPFNAANTTVITTASNPRMVGNVFTTAVTRRVVGVWFTGDNDSDFFIDIFDNDGSTKLYTISIDADFPVGTNAATTLVQYLSTDLTFTAGNNYYVVARSAAGNISNYDLQTFSQVPLSAYNSGLLAKRCYTSTSTPTGPGDWSIDVDKTSLIGILFDAIDTSVTVVSGGETSHTFCC